MKNLICFMVLILLFFGSCSSNSSKNISQENTKEVLEHHWVAFKENDLEAVMADYTEESILITPDSTYKGIDAIRENFKRAFVAFPREQDPLQLNQTVIEEDVAYIIWQANTSDSDLSFATDTFIIRDGKIIRQTYGGVSGPRKKLRHVVAFKFKPEVNVEQIQKVTEDFYALKEKVPQIIEFEGGPDLGFPEMNKYFTHSFMVTVKNEEDLAGYGSHPDHQAFSESVDPLLDEVMVVDYWEE